MDKTRRILAAALMGALLLPAVTVLADPGDAIDQRFDRYGDRRADYWDRKGDRIDRKLDRRGEHVDRRLDRKGARIDDLRQTHRRVGIVVG